MKNYFSFSLTGIKLFPITLMFLVFLGVPYLFLINELRSIQPGKSPSLVILPLYLFMIISALVLSFFRAKLVINNVFFKDKKMDFKGAFGVFLGKVLLGCFLSAITLGVYFPWLITDIQKFFIDNTNYNSNALKFNGKGSKLFVILLLSIILPVILIVIIAATLIKNIGSTPPSGFALIFQIVFMLIIVPYIYLIYKWMMNISYKEYTISWETKFWNSCGKIILEIFLTVITLGIYYPLAILKLHKYFTDRTIAKSADKKRRFGYDIDSKNDFLFIWGQILLTIITLGIYYSWAYCNITSRILEKTYVMDNSEQNSLD